MRLFAGEEVKEINDEKDEIIEDLKQKVKNFEMLSMENEKNSAILAKLFDGGLIDEDGELTNKQIEEDDM